MTESSATVTLVIVFNAILYLCLLGFGGRVIFDVAIARSGRAGVRHGGALTLTLGAIAVVAGAVLVPLNALRSLGLGPEVIIEPSQWVPFVKAIPGPLVTAGVVAVAALLVPALLRFGLGVAAFVLVVAAIASPALVGHSSALQTPLQLTDALHLVVAGIWAGGLSRLPGLLRQDRSDPSAAAAVLARFSSWAAVSVTLITITGVVVAIGRLSSVGELINTSYGRMLVIKFCLVMTILGIAAYNRFQLVPRVREDPDDASAWRTLRRTTAYELAIVIAVVIVTAILTNSASGTSGGGSGHH